MLCAVKIRNNTVVDFTIFEGINLKKASTETMILSWIFYSFSAVLVLSAIMVITARNPVHSVLFLILSFFTSAGIFVLLNAEFIAMIMVIVYVGAVAVLFLFVVMMLDISFSNLREGAMKFVPLGLLIGAVILAELYLAYQTWSQDITVFNQTDALVNAAFNQGEMTNTQALGNLLYTKYILAFQLAGMILLVAMVGAIVLTLRFRPGVRRQNISDQVNRRPEDVMEVKKVTTGSGV